MLVSKKALLPFMQVVARDGPRVDGGIRTLVGDLEDPFGRCASPAFGGYLMFQELTDQGVDGGIVLGSVDFGLADEVGGEIEGDVAELHINKCSTWSCERRTERTIRLLIGRLEFSILFGPVDV